VTKILKNSGFTIKDIIQTIMLLITLAGGVYSYAESQVEIKKNSEGINGNKVYFKEEIQKARQYSYDKTYEMRQDFRELKSAYDADHDAIIELKSDVKHILKEQEKMNKLLEQIIKQK
jgi:septal ring factor EnvC (AmiA/AmiB activator)